MEFIKILYEKLGHRVRTSYNNCIAQRASSKALKLKHYHMVNDVKDFFSGAKPKGTIKVADLIKRILYLHIISLAI